MIPTLLLNLSLTVFAAQLPKVFLPLPLIQQKANYDCGAASLYAVLIYWDAYNGDEPSLFPLLETTEKDGTDPTHLVIGAKHFGLKAGLSENLTIEDLRDALSIGETVILDIQAWREEKTKPPIWNDDWDDGHYVVLLAMDEENAYVMDPSAVGGYAWVPLAELLERWHDFEDRVKPNRYYHRLGIRISGNPRAAGKPLGRPGRLIRME